MAKKKPALNRLIAMFDALVDGYIIDIPEERRKAYRKEAKQIVLDIVEASAKGAVKGAKS